jgi:acetolactate synthase-1/2/3 large subunit
MATSPITADTRVSDAIVSALAEAGVEYVLGIPGGYTGQLFTAMHDHASIRVVQVREESLGSAMAEAYGRLTGKPLVVMGQGEWIAGNAGQGFLEALLGSSPMLIMTEMTDGGPLSHHGPYQGGSGDYGSWDAKSALEGVTKRVMVSHHPAQAIQHTQLALKHALVGEPGPVAVIYRGESLRGKVDADSVPRIYPTGAYLPRPSRAVDEEVLGQAVSALRAAARPVIIAGNGVRVGQACGALMSLARALDAPVATTASGKGVFPELDPLAAGVMGTFGLATAHAAIAESDVVLAVGTKLGPMDTLNENPLLLDPARQTMIQIDVEPLNAGWTFPVDHVLIGQAGYLMDRVRETYEAAGARPDRRAGALRVADAVDRHGELTAAEFTSDEVPVEPARLVSLIQEAFPDSGIVTCDAGENRLFMMHWYRTRFPGGYLQPAGGGGMGYAVPAALGAKLAYPDRPVMATCGDGGFAMSVHGLMTAVQEHLPITVVVFNNNALGWVLHGMGEKAVAAAFDEFDHAAIARSVGCRGIRVASTEGLRAALAEAATTTEPLVIDVPTSLKASFRDLAQTMTGPRWETAG